jgi:hypothetical protein
MTLEHRCRYSKLAVILAILVIAVTLGSACAAPDSSKQPADIPNDGLVIRYLNAPKQVQPLAGADVLCVATDAGNNAITYEWTATGGEIKKKGDDGSLILWVPPEKTGTYTVTVVATNAKGIRATKSATIVVTSEPIQLMVTSVKCYGCSNGIDASRFKSYEIRCDVAAIDSNRLKYTWFATIGKIEGEGPNANWFTGSQYGNALITVIITDDKGNKTEGYLAINVSCCK